MLSIKKHLFYIKYFFFRRQSLKQFSELLIESKLSETKRKDLIFRRLKNIIIHAYKSSEFYKNKFNENNFNPYEFNDFNMVKNIPVITKNDLRENNLLIKNYDKKLIEKSTTGGSTGVPVSVYHDKSYSSEVFGWFVLNCWGAHISDNAGFLERYNPSRGVKGILNKIIWWPTKRVHININILNEDVFFKFYRKCKKQKIVYLEGYVGAVYEFALFLKKHNLTLNNLKFVWTTSAPLNEKTRDTLKSVFGCPVYDQYGSCEINWLAFECEKCSGLHFFDIYRYFEIDSEGNILLTDLTNYQFPLIRYKIGDKVSLRDSSCSCGLTLPLINKVKGRESDLIRFKDGSSVPGEFLTTIFDDYPEAVSQFQFIQKKDYSLCIKFIPVSDKSIITVKNVIFTLEQIWKDKYVSIDCEEVETIPHDLGKIRFIISEI
jgi:phenylacetate-CoA ligase